MKRKGIKNLIVDFGGVLIDLNYQRCLNSFRELGMPDVENALSLSNQQDFFRNYEMGLISTDDFRNVIREKIGKPVTDARIDAAWNSFLVSVPTYKLDLLLALRKDYVVYLLSNTNELHWKWSCMHAFPYKTFRVEDYFEHIFLSYEMKMAKPDVEIFRKVLDDAVLDPKETFFIDDSKANCLAAESLGISTYTPTAGEDWSHLFK
ncbi:MAG: HAD family phosphatase [Bacteroides sp.]|nr:HAD family phosphatase [Bacteroides sp.]